MTATTFYEPAGDDVLATAATRGPWAEDAQHGGPVAALLARTLERGTDPSAARLVRMTVELLRPVPIARLSLTREVVRPGRRIELRRAVCATAGSEVASALGWFVRVDGGLAPPMVDGIDGEGDAPHPLPQADADRGGFWALAWDEGWHTAVERRVETGAWLDPGAATVWFRARLPLVGEEPPSPFARVALAADGANGVSARLDVRRWVFINTDLTVATVRPLVGEWVRLASRTLLAPDGIGLSESRLGDVRGHLGTGLQTLYIDRAR